VPSQPVPATASPHVREKRRKRREEILHAALRAFQKKGYHSTTLDDIAEYLGLRKTALYHYFPDKESILWACHQESLGELDRIIEGAHELKGAAEQLSFVIHEHVRVMTDTLEGSPLAFEVSAFSPDRQEAIVEARDRYERAVRSIISRGIRSGEFRDVDPKVAVFAILGSINWIARWYRPEGTLHAEDLGRQFSDYLVRGLACGAPPDLSQALPQAR
jgi:AcrR family transcriptional regulator